HSGQGSDMGLFGGLLGWDADDERLKDHEMYIKKAGIKIDIDIRPINASHPNTYKITLKNKLETHQIIGLSTGGGMIEIIEIDQSPVSLMGDFNLTLFIGDSTPDLLESISKMGLGEVSLHSGSS